jgi:FtsH-binding integral membrane protein
MKSLKSMLKIWQEIALILPIVFGLTLLAKAVMLGYTMDGADIFLVCFFVPLLICLIGQFFWKNKGLAICLSVLLGISSFVVILMALYGISTTSIETIMTQSIIMLIWGIIGVVAAITMPKKYFPNNTLVTLDNVEIC